jgi:hypothetical protein
MAVSCSNETEPDIRAEQGKLTFTLPKSPGTYAEVASDANEKTIREITILMFNPSTNALVNKFSTGSADAVILSGDTRSGYTATIDVSKYNDTYNFYMVANNNAALSNFTGNLSDLANIKTTTIRDISDLPADKLPMVSPGANVNVNIGTAPIKLSRTVARLDIDNPVNSGFVVERVSITNAKKEGYLYNPDPANTGAGVNKDIDVRVVPGERKNIAYLFPTITGERNNGISFTIRGQYTLTRETHTYAVNVTQSFIENNNIYKINIVPDNHQQAFNLTVENWGERIDAGEIVTDLEGTIGKLFFQGAPFDIIQDGGELYDPENDGLVSSYNTSKPDDKNVLNLWIASGSDKNPDDQVTVNDYNESGAKLVTGWIGKRRYGSGYAHLLRIELPEASAFSSVIHVKNTDQKYYIGNVGKVILYPVGNTWMPGVEFERFVLAPVNLGATTIPLSAPDYIDHGTDVPRQWVNGSFNPCPAGWEVPVEDGFVQFTDWLTINKELKITALSPYDAIPYEWGYYNNFTGGSTDLDGSFMRSLAMIIRNPSWFVMDQTYSTDEHPHALTHVSFGELRRDGDAYVELFFNLHLRCVKYK